ncbi:MAG: hypothetical protein ACTSV2_12860 [Candidatus Thorarchaeota archaeon]
MNQFTCLHCSAPFEMDRQSSTVVCPYCNTTIQVKTGEVLKEHYMMRLQFNLDQVKGKMFSWALKQLGAPKNLPEKSTIEKSQLVFWPFWVIEVEAKADYSGTQNKPNFSGDTAPVRGKMKVYEKGHLDLERDIIIPASKKVPKQLTKYIIATKRKEFFQHDTVLDVQGSLRPIVIERDEALKSARKQMNDILHEEAYKEVDKIISMEPELNISAIFLIHIPIWEIKYDYSIRKYDAMVDGASGRIVFLEFPRKIAFRAMTMLGGLIHLVVGGGLGLLLVYLGWLAGDPLFPTITGIILGLGMLALATRFFWTAISLKAGEEMAE